MQRLALPRKVIVMNEDDEDVNVEFKLPAIHVIIIVFILFFVSGLVVGYAIGGYNSHKNWEKYNDYREEYVEENCNCVNKTISSFGWGGEYI